MLGLQANLLESDKATHLISSKNRIESIAMVHEMLYQNENYEKIDFAIYIENLAHYISRIYGEGEQVHLNIQSDSTPLPLQEMIQLALITNELITNELITNAYKYAFKEATYKAINITLTQTKKQYHYHFEDNGCGVENIDDISTFKSLGLKLVRLASKQLDATIEFRNDNGFKVDIYFER
jgi:two-component sensor histidine kinase